MTNALRDNNHVTTMLGTYFVDGVTLIPIEIDPSSGGLKTNTTDTLVDYTVPVVLENDAGNPAPEEGFSGSTIMADGDTWSLFYNETTEVTAATIAIPYARQNPGANYCDAITFNIINVTDGNSLLHTQPFTIDTWVYYEGGAGVWNNDPADWQQIELTVPVVLPANKSIKFQTVYQATGSSSNRTALTWIDTVSASPYTALKGVNLTNHKAIYAVYAENLFTPTEDALRDENFVDVLMAVDSTDATKTIPVYVDADGAVLIGT